MNFENLKNYDTEDFVLDENFCRWVNNPDQESDHFWRSFCENNPEKTIAIKEAVLILKSIRPIEENIPEEVLERLYVRIIPSSAPSRKNPYFWLKVAAAILVLVSLAAVILLSVNNKPRMPLMATGGNLFEKGRLILPDGTVREFDEENAQIVHSSEGGLTLNNDTVVRDLKPVQSSGVKMNHIIIPYGKRSDITLADGTRIWLNSGSQLSYPSDFGKGSREIYLTGEAFFEVAHNPSMPCIVYTNDLKIKVLGTRFNVESYGNDARTQAVLVEGIISAGRNRMISRPVELIPGERLIFDREKEVISKDMVDVCLYTSWVNGYLVFEQENLAEIFKKLERYYNKPIMVEEGIEKITFSGKLDLTEDIERVFGNISFSASFKYESENEVYTIKP
jgi:ferric-dicitrate binding protein FerR (iron transport regulator)